MAVYSIKDLERISGVKAHTLRVWEQRYGILQPKRTDTNIRYYDECDLRTLLNICMLNCSGYKISAIASMSQEEICGCVQNLSDSCQEYLQQINSLTIAMMDLNEALFEKVFAAGIARYGFEATMLRIVYPFFEKVGVMWQTGSVKPGHEHFISHLIRQKIIAAINVQKAPVSSHAKKFLLFLPEGEYHELSLLFSHYLLKSRGCRVIYMGQSLPYDELVTIYEAWKPDYMLTLVTSRHCVEEMSDCLFSIGEDFNQCEVLLAGKALEGTLKELPPNFRYLMGIEQLITLAEEGEGEMAGGPDREKFLF